MEIFRSLIVRHHDSGRSYFVEVFIERLFDRRQKLTAAQKIGIARVFAEVMDEVVEGPKVAFGVFGPWERARRLLDRDVASHFPDLVRTGASINWLSLVLRDQGFAFGVPDSDRAREDRQWLTNAEFNQAVSIALERLRSIGISGISQKPQPLQMFYFWKQLGNEIELRNEMQEALDKDDVFVDLMQAMRTWVDSSNKGLYMPLRREIVEQFLDADAAKRKLMSLANGIGSIAERAAKILAEWEDGR